MSKKRKILVGMSGGVDSSVTALLLKKEGYEVTGVFMINWHEDDADGNCTWQQDFLDAQRVAEKIGIKIFTWDFSEEYKKNVFYYFIKAYESGLTPNPDTLCNKYIKFGSFLEKAMLMGYDKVATGHYAQIRENKGMFDLLSGVDSSKDQTYFLYELGQKQLAKILFPIGHLPKKEVRKIAEENDLPVSQKKDSYGICYIGEKKMKSFLGKFIENKKGEIVDKFGNALGEHEGLHNYTLGQRQGIGVGGVGPFYVLRKDFETNKLIVTDNKDDDELFQKEIYTKDINWVLGENQKMPKNCWVRFRHLQKLQKAHLKKQKDDTIKIVFKIRQKTPVPGQVCVFYKKNIFVKKITCLGGGIIVAKQK